MDLLALKQDLADFAARAALRFPPFERALAAACGQPRLLDHLRLGAIAVGYTRVLKRRELRVADFGDYKFYVNVAEPLGIGPYFFHDSGTVWLTRGLIRRDDVCIDAGSNAGHYTFLAASCVGTSGRVFAFDPNPEFAELVKRSIALNGFGSFVSIEPRALWSRDDEEKVFFLSINPANTGTSSLVDHGWYLSPERSIRVMTTTLDTFARERGLERIRLIKIDVERAEHEVLAGAKGLLGRGSIDYLIVEMYSGSESQAIIEKQGYRVYLLDAVAKRLVPSAKVDAELFADYLCVSPAQFDAFKSDFAGSIAS